MYILECNDGTYYTGSTKDLERRLKQHKEGKGSIIRQNDYLLNYYITKNMIESTKLFTAKNKFRDGVERKKKH